MNAVTPESIDELSEAMRATADSGSVVAVRGGGSKSSWGGSGRPVDLVVDTTGLDQVVEHAVDDLVVTVQAGVRLADLQQRLAAHGQWLALDPPEADATIGGVVATASSGPRRLRFGTPRDLLLGMTVVLADGRVARSGGRVVKNVAGYDVGKLFVGAYGTLGVVAACTFRLHPVARALRVVTVGSDEPAARVSALLRSPVQPAAIEWDGRELHVVIEGHEAAVDPQARAVSELVGGAVTDRLPSHFGQRPWADGEVGLKVTHRLSAFGAVLVDLARLLPGARVSAHAGSGVLWLGWPGDLARLDELRAAVAAYDGSVVVVDAPAEMKATVDVWGPVRGLAVMRRIKQQFDPDGRMAPGRFVGGI